MKKADIGVGLGLIVLSVWMFLFSLKYSEAAIYYYGPNFLPQFLALVMAGCAPALVINGLRDRVLAAADSIDLRVFFRMLIAVAMCLGCLLLTRVIGFAFGTAVSLFALMVFLKQENVRK